MFRLAALLSALLLASAVPCQTVPQHGTTPQYEALATPAHGTIAQPSQRAAMLAQQAIVPDRFVVVYRNGKIPANAADLAALAGAHIVARLDRLGIVSIVGNAIPASNATIYDATGNTTAAVNSNAAAITTAHDTALQTALAAQPNVLAVLHDHYVQAHGLIFAARQSSSRIAARISARPLARPLLSGNPAGEAALPSHVALPRQNPGSGAPSLGPINDQNTDTGSVPQPMPVNVPISETVSIPVDTYYNSPQGWAVRQAGGFGDNVPGGASTGPWNASRGAGVRIAILDSGIDSTQPSLAPNIALNLSEVDQSPQTGLPSACDDGSPQDQQGHGTWTASLAAAALDAGQVVGVAPQATLLNIKVLERLPAAATSASETVAAQCEAGQAGGLLSWVLEGINDAVAQHANVISLSLGTLVDITTGDGAGWKAAFDQATYAASQAGVVIIAATGNDGLNLSSGNFIELPAQARGVLPVVASTNPVCAENLAPDATCTAGRVTRPSYSNYGATLHAISAPGGNAPEGSDSGVSGFVRGACSSGLPNTTDGLPSAGQSFGCFGFGHAQYVQAMGTSASAALVAGAAALLEAANPSWTAAQIVAALRTSATTTSSMAEPQLNLSAALTLQ